jgi:hypothetical protein
MNKKSEEASERRAMPGSLSILQLSQLTGKSREHVTVKVADLPFSDGTKGAKLYESKAALAAIYCPGGHASPQDALAAKRVEEIELNMEVTRKERPRREDVIRDFGQVCGKMGDMIRSFPGLPDDLRTDLLTALREFLDRLENI